jgi:iron complex transport system substrate-binding protein
MVALAMGRVAVALTILVLLGTTACGERSEPTGVTAPLYPVTVQSGDRPIVVKQAARRIAVLDASTESIVRALGAGSQIVASPPDGRIDAAALRRARPDLVVAAESTDEQSVSRAASLTHATVYTAPGDSIRQVERSITQLGALTGQPVAARGLIRRIESQREAVAARLARVPGVTVFVDTGFFTPVSDQSLAGDMIREAHAKNVAGANRSGPIELADLLQLDPDVYVTTSDAGVTLADLRRNKKTRKLRAIRQGRFRTLDVGLLAPGPQIGDGLLQLARLLHPNAFR